MKHVDSYLKSLKDFGETAEGYALDLRADLARLMLHGLKNSPVNQSELAKAIKTTPAQISKIIHSDANCQISTIATVLHFLGIKPCLMEAGNTHVADTFRMSDYAKVAAHGEAAEATTKKAVGDTGSTAGADGAKEAQPRLKFTGGSKNRIDLAWGRTGSLG
jgi:predicted XRE-type DNA-binding protein